MRDRNGDSRYRVMAAFRVRNIAGYNAKVREAETEQGNPLLDPLIPLIEDVEPKVFAVNFHK